MSNQELLRTIKTFPLLIKYLRDELNWPIESTDFDELTFDYNPEELGLDKETAVKIKEIKQLRPLHTNQPWGIFFINFEPKSLPVVVLRRILRSLVIKKRQSANKAQQATWKLHDLLFISSYGESDHRDITFAHFSEDPGMGDLPALRVLGWDDENTVAHLDHAHKTLKEKLRWPEDSSDIDKWRATWSQAFILRNREVVTTAKDLAVRMAELATAIRKRVNRVLAIESTKGPLRKLHAAFKEALIHDLTEDDFADMYAQTITYGLLSARVSRPAGLVAENIANMVPVTNPFLRDLLSTFLTVGGRKDKIDFDELGINEVVQALRDAKMEAVLRDFGDKNPQEDPVIHFYELFLKEYDPKKRMQRGVFYTPRPVVSFIVRSVDELLRTEFGLADGLADITTWGEMAKSHPDLEIPKGVKANDPFVQILDPATGTGTFLVEVIAVIQKAMCAKWQKQGKAGKAIDLLWNQYVAEHLLPRLYGFELMMAPYAIAHMKIGLKLHETGYHFASHERARIYLTNSLEKAQDISDRFEFDAPALAHEAHAVNAVKEHKRFTVVIGNPPYSGESANKIEWIERNVKETYQCIDGVPIKEKGKKNWLLDDYVKFLRLSHMTIVATGCGLVGHIINNAFQDNPTFRGLRRSLLKDFSDVKILDLHGSGTRSDSIEEAKSDENVFDILQGVCVLVLNRPAQRKKAVTVARGDLWGRRVKKYELLSDGTPASLIHDRVHPKPDQWYFIPLDLTHETEWQSCVSLLDAMPVNGNGLISAKDHFAYAISPAELQRDLDVFLNARLTDKQVAEHLHIKDNSMWSLHDGRLRLRRERSNAQFCRVAYRPFDTRYSLFHRDVIFNLRLPVTQYIIGGKNLVLLITRMTKGDDWRHCFVTRHVSDCAFLSNQTSTNAFAFPLKRKTSTEGLFAAQSTCDANLAPQFVARMAGALSVSASTKKKEYAPAPEDIFYYVYAVFHSPGYRSRYAEFLKIDFPRLPLTESLELFCALGRLGNELVALHLMESPKLDKHLTKFIGSGRFEVEKISYSDKTVWIDKEQTQGFRGVPENVWPFHIGGYQVCEKWLKYRKDRKLSKADIKHYHRIVVALSETIHLMAEIDKVIESHGGWPDAFALKQSKSEEALKAAESELPYELK